MTTTRLFHPGRLLPVLLAALPLAGSAGCRAGGVKITPIPADRTLEEVTLIRGAGLSPAKIALIHVDGILVNAETNGWFEEGEHPVSLVQEQLSRAEHDPRVKAVVLRINSPGGTVTASELIYHEVRSFRQRTGKPVVAMMMDVAASGGYYVAMACDEVIAHPTTITGSIGVVMQTFDLSGTMQKIGARSTAIKSGPVKDAGSPLRPLTPEEQAIFQGIINEFFDGFVEVVKAGRPDLDEQKIRQLADGRVYTGEQALEAGLVDRLGSVGDAVQSCMDRAALRNASLVRYHRPLDWTPNVYTGAPQAPTAGTGLTLALPRRLTQPAPRFLYLWAPGL